MTEYTSTKDRLIGEFTENYLKTLFYFCLKKTGNSIEAEDLASDIALNILASLNKGIVPDSFSAWVWTIARNRYSVWAANKHRRRNSEMDFEEGGCAEELLSAGAEDDLIRKEERALLRRELAFVSSDYRNIVLAYYIEDRSVKDIALSLGMPEGTVKARLFRARTILKEGMNMAREFGVRSYKPEEVSFVSNGNQPSGLPWSAVQGMIPKNLLLQASGNPSTPEELSIELGIAMPYVEDEVRKLVDATLMKKLDNGKYITDFFIINKECRMELYVAASKDQAVRNRLYNEIATDLVKSISDIGVRRYGLSDEELKWEILLSVIDYCGQNIKGYQGSYPQKRANGETWGFVGYEMAPLPNCFIGHNGCNPFPYAFWAYKIPDYNMWDRAGELSYRGIVLLGDVLKNDRNASSFTEAEKKIWEEDIEGRFACVGEQGKIISKLPVMDEHAKKKFHAFIEGHPAFEKLMVQVQGVFDEFISIMGKENNPVLKEQLAFCASMQIYDLRMMALRELVSAGALILPENPDDSTVAMMFYI